MRKALGLLGSALALGGLLALGQARADAPVRLEKGLNGIRIMASYRDVLRAYGQPSMIIRAGEKLVFDMARTPEGAPTGGVRSVSYTGGGGSGASGGPSAPGGPGGPGSMGGPGGAMGVPGGKGGMSGPPSMGGGPGAMGGGAGGDESKTFAQSGGYLWVYHNARTELALVFAFNINGRLLATAEIGHGGGGATQLGVRLGDPIKNVYEKYGWPDSIREQGEGFSLNYSTKYHMQIGILKNKVFGIGVTLFEDLGINFFPEDSNGGGGGGASAGGGGLGRPGGGGGGGNVGKAND